MSKAALEKELTKLGPTIYITRSIERELKEELKEVLKDNKSEKNNE